jgi:hypothetical protein
LMFSYKCWKSWFSLVTVWPAPDTFRNILIFISTLYPTTDFWKKGGKEWCVIKQRNWQPSFENICTAVKEPF